MNISADVEVHFHEQEKASIFHETNCVDNDERFAEIAVCTSYAIRMMSNLGQHEVTDSLGSALQIVPGLIAEVANGNHPSSPALIAYPGYKGRKRFIASLRINGSSSSFDFQAKGFGFFAKAVGYYGPTSVLTLYRYMASRRPTETEYLEVLSQSAVICGNLQLRRMITMSNHVTLESMVWAEACPQYIPT